jgi:hypothetical protein
VFEVHSGLNVLVDTLPRSRASQEADWPTVKDDDPRDGTDSLPEALKLLVVSNVGVGRGRDTSCLVPPHGSVHALISAYGSYLG